MKKLAVRVYVSCNKCGQEGYVDLTKKELKKMLILFKRGDQVRKNEKRR